MVSLHVFKVFLCLFVLFFSPAYAQEAAQSWIRINQIGYKPENTKVAVFVSKGVQAVNIFQLVDQKNDRVVFKKKAGKDFGKYGPFNSSYRLDFSEFKRSGTYYIKAGTARSAGFVVSDDVYKGSADFVLRYMRQQRSGFNPFLNDSCHTKDGYIIYGPDSVAVHTDVSGGWHDATDYLQYSTTSANATYHLLAAYRDFPGSFTDSCQANGLKGKNGIRDVLDEANWGLRWLQKMHPREGWMFNQIADDRDHAGYRLPGNDSVDYGYGPGNGRPVYFITGRPQGLGKYQNRADGAASTAGKFASAFALAAHIYSKTDTALSNTFRRKSLTAFQLGLDKPGVAQTAPNKAPYFYEEDNWTDDMELGAAALFQLTADSAFFSRSLTYSELEKVSPWMGADTARHYQWYPFHNFGHYELAKGGNAATKAKLISYYREGIERVWQKSGGNAFYRGIPFIWCSNNLTVSFAIQCYLYRIMSGDGSYARLEQASFDWLFGCNPWGTSMVCGLPAAGDTPADPHSSLSFLHNYPLDGGLVDGPVYGSIYSNLIGVRLRDADEYAGFQSDLAVYHDDAGDFSTNEPTMDGTASLIYLLAAQDTGSPGVAEKKK